MKKLVLFMAVATAVAFAACGNNEESEETTEEEVATEEVAPVEEAPVEEVPADTAVVAE